MAGVSRWKGWWWRGFRRCGGRRGCSQAGVPQNEDGLVGGDFGTRTISEGPARERTGWVVNRSAERGLRRLTALPVRERDVGRLLRLFRKGYSPGTAVRSKAGVHGAESSHVHGPTTCGSDRMLLLWVQALPELQENSAGSEMMEQRVRSEGTKTPAPESIESSSAPADRPFHESVWSWHSRVPRSADATGFRDLPQGWSTFRSSQWPTITSSLTPGPGSRGSAR